MCAIKAVVADDHAVLRIGIANILKDLPELVLAGEVGNGLELFPVLASTQPDLLLLDVYMPNFEPISAVVKIRELYPDLKILVLSAHADHEYVQSLLRAGVHGYHLKDQPINDLRLAVQRVLAGERWVCSPLVDGLVRLHETAQSLQVPLSRRQGELLGYLQQGLDNLEIARQTGLSIKTVENHLTRLYRHLKVQSRLEAVSYARQHPGLIAASEAGTMPGGALTLSALPRLNILMVDDNGRYRIQLRGMIGRACPQAQIYEADDIEGAVRLARSIAFQLAFIDVVMGDESGIDCARRLKERSAATQIILLSAYPDRAFHRLGLEAGAVAFVDKKDLDAAAVRKIVDDVLH